MKGVPLKKKAGKAKAAGKKVKDLPAKKLNAKSARSVRGGRKAGKGQQEFLVVKMNDVIITGVVHGGSGEGSSETVSLVFAKVDFEYRPQKIDGTLDAGIHFKFDIKANKSG
jgi:hypothetical protein